MQSRLLSPLCVLGMAMTSLAADIAGTGGAVEAGAVARPIVVAYCQRVTQPPTIDGQMNDPCWQQCQALDSYVLDKTDRLAGQQTVARVCYDDKFIYFAFQCHEDDMAHTKAVTRGRSLPWFEDSVEIFIDPTYRQQDYKQFGANFLGACNIDSPADSPGMVMAQGSRGDTGYVIEARIPLASLKLQGPPDGKTWGLNLTRNRYRPGADEHSSWGRLRDSFHKPMEFGQLIFAPRPVVAVQSIQADWKTTGLNRLQVLLSNSSAAPIDVELLCGDARATATIPAGAQQSVPCLIRLAAGVNRLPLTVRAGGQVVYRQETPLVAGAAPAGLGQLEGVGCFRILTDESVCYQGQQLIAHAEVATLNDPAAMQHLTLTAKAGPTTQTATGAQKLQLDIPQGPDGQVVLNLQVSGPDGKCRLETSKSVPIRGLAHAAYEKQLTALENRLNLQALSLPESSPLAKEIDYSRRKITRIKTLLETLNDTNLRQVQFQIPELTYSLDMLEKGQQPVWGLRNRLYVSAIDGSQQGYVAVIPPSYVADDKAKLPLLIFLHGYINDAPWQPEGYMDALRLACAANNTILVLPYGRGSQWYRYDGETDVWDVLEQMRRDYRVDEDRIYLGGFSMGGGGTLHLGSSRPDLLAAAVACSMAPRPEQLHNLLHVPTWFFCGGQEDCAPALAHAAEVMTAQGAEAHFSSDPASGHTIDFINFDKLIPWLLEHRLVRDPRRIAFIAQDGLHSRAYWATIDGFVDYGRPASMDIAVKGQTITITAANATSLTLRPTSAVLDTTRPIQVVLNGQVQPVAALSADGSLHVQGDVAATRPAAGAPAKSAATPSGPIAAVFARPFLVVYAGGQAATSNQAEAEALIKLWNSWHHGAATPLPDSALTPQMVQDHDLVIIGSPAADSLIGRCAAALPLGMTADKLRVGQHEFAGQNLGVCILGINPLAPQRYVLLVSGQSATALQAARQQLSTTKEDFVVVSGSPQGRPKVVESGWFGRDWQSITVGAKR